MWWSWVYVLHFGTFGISPSGLFWSLGYSLSTSHDTRSPIWSWETHLQHAEHDVLLQLCSKYFAGMCLMWNFNFQITTVSSELTFRQYLKRGDRKLRLLGFGKSRTVSPFNCFFTKTKMYNSVNFCLKLTVLQAFLNAYLNFFLFIRQNWYRARKWETKLVANVLSE